MAYIREEFDSSMERNKRWQELKRTHDGVVRYSEPEAESKLPDETIIWVDKYIVAYPPQLYPGMSHE